MKPSICGACGESGDRIVNLPFDATYNQIPVRLDMVEMYECSRCRERTFTPEQAQEVAKKVKAIARERLNLLPPDKIISIRRRYSLSQEDLEHLLGLGRKVVTRWERGKVLQSKTADVVLRLMDRSPAILEELKQIRS